MPSPSQLSQLQHPLKPGARPSNLSSGSSSSSDDSPHVREISYELADSIQQVVQTLLQVSPPQILDMTKEQFSACSLSVPASSMSAMFTVMKNINYLSANMGGYFGEFPPAGGTSARSAEKQPMQNSEENDMEFDIAEVLQCVGDSLSGTAAQVGVDLVIYHGDVSLKHVNVVGDEAGLSYAISHVIRQILNVAERGDTLELGLLLVPVPPNEGEASTSSDDIPLHCTLRIGHRFAFPERIPNGPYGPEPEQVRQQPNFSALLLRRILRQTNGTLIGDLPPSENYASGRTVELSFPLRRPRSTLSTPFDETGLPEEPQYHHDPTLRQLVLFAETLKGKKATLYASPEACFAQHLTSYLTAWGMEVIHVSPDGNIDGAPGNDPMSPPMEGVEAGPAPPTAPKASPPDPVFVLIDDDVEVLRERLLAQRSEHNALAANQAVRKRPPLASLHRPRSTVNIPTAPNQANLKASSVVIIHFTSLSNYKLLKDMVQTIMAGYFAATLPLPEVMILPKPAGPRRFLTALHTAATKPSVDLPFLPIATSPATPASSHSGSFFSPLSNHEPVLPKIVNTPPPPPQPVSPNKALRPAGPRSNSDRSVVSNAISESAGPPITPSPLSIPDSAEYFADAAHKLGSTPSSGMVVQSPDGQPAGILFRPRIRGNSRAGSGENRGQIGMPTPMARKTSGPRSSENGTTFSTLYANSAAPSPSIHKRSPLGAPPEPLDGAAAAASLAKHAVPSSSKKDKIPSPIVAPKVVEASKPVSPSSPPGRSDGPASLRRRHQRKLTQESGPGGLKKGKGGDDIIPPISVLIVDDNPINQTILSTFMKRKKIKYDIANNGAEAVNKWKSGGFHLILMDIQMPVMDGIQATKEIRKMEKANAMAGFPPLTPTGEGSSTPSEATSEGRAMPSPYRSSVIIVALTASSLQSDRHAALAAGCNDFLTKPVSLLWLNNKIIEWGSIKALQVWADIRPDVTRMNAGQALQARAVADRLQVPRGKKSPSPTTRRPSGLNKEEGAAALALASPNVTLKNPAANGPMSPTAERPPAPPISSHSSSTKSREGSPEIPKSELPPESKDPAQASSIMTNGKAQAAQATPPPEPEDGADAVPEKSIPSRDVDMEANEDQHMSSPEQRRGSTEDYNMGDPLTKTEQDKEDKEVAESGLDVPALNVQDATPGEPPAPPPPLGMDRDQ
ncbi:response regulator receiver domain-containing protein [Coprinopsis sp. MPI-PUGE-AT-0042]|nr:response regulator receiver domain-containing protein [Coprinopsis sp. MPI-PUGE-AT-0042]